MTYIKRLVQAALATALACLVADAGAQAVGAPTNPGEIGRWITQSGKLEVDIAACGAFLCGTITRVIDDGAAPAATPAAASPLGVQILTGMKAAPEGGYTGQIYNRADGKTYASRIALAGPAQLSVSIYANPSGSPIVQTWHRAESQR